MAIWARAGAPGERVPPARLGSREPDRARDLDLTDGWWRRSDDPIGDHVLQSYLGGIIDREKILAHQI